MTWHCTGGKPLPKAMMIQLIDAYAPQCHKKSQFPYSGTTWKQGIIYKTVSCDELQSSEEKINYVMVTFVEKRSHILVSSGSRLCRHHVWLKYTSWNNYFQTPGTEEQSWLLGTWKTPYCPITITTSMSRQRSTSKGMIWMSSSGYTERNICVTMIGLGTGGWKRTTPTYVSSMRIWRQTFTRRHAG